MRHHSDFCSGLARGVLIGVLVTSVVMLSFPVVAAVGGNLILGKANTADATTSLSGAATTNLRITNTQAASPALDLRVVAGAAPLKVNSTTRVPNLNADRLDGKHASAFLLTTGTAANSLLLDGLDSTAFALTGHSHTGVYLPLAGKAADASLLDGLDSTAFSLASHAHDASAITAGTLAEGRFSAYLDLVAEGYLGNDTGTDLLTRDQADARFADSSPTCPPGRTIVGYQRAGILCSSSIGAVVVDDTAYFEDTTMVLDSSGLPAIAYWDVSNMGLKLVRCGNATCSSGNAFSTPPIVPGYNTGHQPSMVLDSVGFPVISYYDAANGDLGLIHCGDRDCITGSATVIDSLWDVGSGSSLVLDVAGRPVISYYDSTNKDLKVVHCGNTACNSGNAIVTVDSAGQVGSYSSLVLDTAGRPVVAYYDAVTGDLKLAHCGDSNCASGNTITIAVSTGDAGRYASISLDLSGNPVVSYYDALTGDLKLVHCGDSNCASDNVVTTVDDTGDVGRYSSLVLDASGNPVIAYQDVDGNALKVARCGDQACSSRALYALPSTGTTGRFASLTLDASGSPLVSFCDHGAGGYLKLAVVIS